MKKNKTTNPLIWIFILVFASKISNGQCFINKTSFPIGNFYTSKDVLLYVTKDKDFEISASLEKAFKQDDFTFNIIFTISGHIKYFFVPNIAEITTINDKKIYLYIPKQSGRGEVGNYLNIECYGNFEKTDENIITLMGEGLKEIILKNDTKNIALKPNANLFIEIFNCLKEKTK